MFRLLSAFTTAFAVVWLSHGVSTGVMVDVARFAIGYHVANLVLDLLKKGVNHVND